MKRNIILIGMPASGKSTLGYVLATRLSMAYLDTDDVLKEKLQLPLQDAIDECGIEYFLQKEEEAVLSIETSNTIIATGGSVVYSKKAMEHLKQTGLCVFLSVPYATIEERIDNLETRGVANMQGHSLQDLYKERTPLYLEYADLVFKETDETGDLTIDEHTNKLISLLKEL